MLDIWNLEWANQNALRAYPLASYANRTNNTDDFIITDDIFIGVSLSIAGAIGETPTDEIDITKFYISCIGLEPTIAYFEVSYNNIIIGKGSITYSDYELNPGIPLVINLIPKNNVNMYCHIVIGDVEALQKLPFGYWYFTVEGCPIDPDCIHLHPMTAQTITFINPDNSEIVLSGGNIVIRAAGDLTFTANDTVNGITEISMVCTTSIPDPEVLGAVKYINGVAPDATGNISIIPGECINITSDQDSYSIAIEDTCATPCCACDELDKLKDKATELNNMTFTMQALLAALNNKIFST